jgi:hypothetical protein
MEESADNSLLTRNRVSHFEFERAKQNWWKMVAVAGS